MPKFLEDILGNAADSKGLSDDDKDSYIYGTMNNLGAIKGNKETSKGRAMQAKHNSKVKPGFPLKKKKKKSTVDG